MSSLFEMKKRHKCSVSHGTDSDFCESRVLLAAVSGFRAWGTFAEHDGNVTGPGGNSEIPAHGLLQKEREIDIMRECLAGMNDILGFISRDDLRTEPI